MADDGARGNWLGIEGDVAVVTGAGGGIGKGIAAALAEAGAEVWVLDREQAVCDAAAAEIGRGARGLAFDAGDRATIAAAAERIGACDILVNNAGILRGGSLAETSAEDWELVLRINLTGYLACAQAFGADMRRRRRGALVHVASIAASEPQAWSGAYSASKAAVAMLSRQLAFEWGPDGVRSNSVSPGMIRTPLSEGFYQVPGILEARAAVVPARRVGAPADIADVVAFLASRRAGYVTGQDVVVDGGYAQTLMAHVPRPGHEQGSGA
jgi:NAD(P)-dependent dehydrogenase (short-subunit alcohol dehydrogenase family)